MNKALSDIGGWKLTNAPVRALLNAQAELGLVSFYIQTEKLLENWEERHGHVERLLIGDNEYEVSQLTDSVQHNKDLPFALALGCTLAQRSRDAHRIRNLRCIRALWRS